MHGDERQFRWSGVSAHDRVDARFTPQTRPSRRCFVIPATREGTVAEQNRYRSDKPEGGAEAAHAR